MPNRVRTSSRLLGLQAEYGMIIKDRLTGTTSAPPAPAPEPEPEPASTSNGAPASSESSTGATEATTSQADTSGPSGWAGYMASGKTNRWPAYIAEERATAKAIQIADQVRARLENIPNLQSSQHCTPIVATLARDIRIPQSYGEAMASVHSDHWRQACDAEMESHREQGTWIQERAPQGVRPIGLKWVFDLKTDSLGRVIRFKARLVAKGYLQRAGIDFHDIYSPVVRHVTLRTVLAMVAAQDLELHQLDVTTAFLNAPLAETLYCSQPEGYSEGSGTGRLLKAIYGLKQANRAGNLKAVSDLLKDKLFQSTTDPCLFIKPAVATSAAVYVLLYVDDYLIASTCMGEIARVKAVLMTQYKCTDLGEARTFIGYEITRDRKAKSLTISQTTMINNLLYHYNMEDANPSSLPMPTGTILDKLTTEGGPRDLPYPDLVGSLMYIATCTRPDISQAVGQLARHTGAFEQSHWLAAKQVLRYLGGTREVGIKYGKNPSSPSITTVPHLSAHCDANYAMDMPDRKSTTGLVLTSWGGAIDWASTRQATMASSTTEAEYQAASQAAKHALWLRKLLYDLYTISTTITILGDNKATLSILDQPISHSRTKHIDVHHNLICERARRNEVHFSYVPTAANISDFLTKQVPLAKFRMCCKAVGLSGFSWDSRV